VILGFISLGDSSSSGDAKAAGTNSHESDLADTQPGEASTRPGAGAGESAKNIAEAPPPVVEYPAESKPPVPAMQPASLEEDSPGGGAGDNLGEDAPGVSPAAKKSAPPVPGRVADRAGGRKARAHVHVGVFPWGRVWIDGKEYGEAPVETDIAAGKHIIAGGKDGPTSSHTVRLKPGVSKEVVIDLKSGTTRVRKGR
jgi:hypothetical protein